MNPYDTWLPEIYDEKQALKYRTPFHTFLIKVSTLCNLNCDYCYVYQSPDTSWKQKPKFLSYETAVQVAFRINEHVIQHKLNRISIIFHGGEPLLAGVFRLEALIELFVSSIRCHIDFGMQTNGVLLDKSFINLFLKYKFKVGISLDGPQKHNDKHRVYHNGKGSFNDVEKAIQLVHSTEINRSIFGGLLIVVDLDISPDEVLQLINSLHVKSANFILPDGHYEIPPPGYSVDYPNYGIWLFSLFTKWFEEYPDIEISYFEQIITMLIGGNSTAEEIGSLSVDFLVVEANGDIEPVDTLKIVGREVTNLNMNVYSHSFNDALNHPAIFSRMSGYAVLCDTCQKCKYLHNCGGGYIPHRFSKQNGFLNPSIYCGNLKYLFDNIINYLNVNC